MGKRCKNPNDQKACTVNKHKLLKKESPKPTESEKKKRHPEYRRLFCDTIQNHMTINISEWKLNHEWKGKNGSQQPELYTFLKNQKGKKRSLAFFYVVYQDYEKDSEGNIKGPKYLQQCTQIFQTYKEQISNKQLSPQQVARQKKLLKEVLKLSRLNEFRYTFNLNLQPSQSAIRLNVPNKKLRVVRNKDSLERYEGSKNFHKLIKQFKGKKLYDNRVQAQRQYIRFVSFWQDLTNDPFQNMPEPIVADNEAEQTDMLQHQSGHNQNDNLSTEGQLQQSNSTAIIDEALRSTMSSVAMNRFDENNQKIEQPTFDGKDDWTTGGWKKCLQP